MASGAGAGENRLIKNDRGHVAGICRRLSGGGDGGSERRQPGMQTDRPPMVITRGQENIIEQLGGKPALLALRELINGLSPAEQKLLQHGLLIGRAISEYRDTFGRGDFLGAQHHRRRSGHRIALRWGILSTSGRPCSSTFAMLPPPMRICRDARRRRSTGRRAVVQLQWPGDEICLKRRIMMWVLRGDKMPGTPIAGFFAAGEIGPVGGKNFVHGHTASLALFGRGRIEHETPFIRSDAGRCPAVGWVGDSRAAVRGMRQPCARGCDHQAGRGCAHDQAFRCGEPRRSDEGRGGGFIASVASVARRANLFWNHQHVRQRRETNLESPNHREENRR